MHTLTADSTRTYSDQSRIESWISSLHAPFLSRIMPSQGAVEATCSLSRKAKRQLEFTTGRRCAESILKQFGNADQVWSNADRSPAWPAGFAGSISHSESWTWAVVAEQPQTTSIGIDTEKIVSQQMRNEILFEIVTADEWETCRNSTLNSEQLFSVIFSAKEAFYKCCYPLDRQYFGFEHAVVDSITADRIRICTHETNPSVGKIPAWLDVRFQIVGEDVFTATWIEGTK